MTNDFLYSFCMERRSCLMLNDLLYAVWNYLYAAGLLHCTCIICWGSIIICFGSKIKWCGFIIVCCGFNIMCYGSIPEYRYMHLFFLLDPTEENGRFYYRNTISERYLQKAVDKLTHQLIYLHFCCFVEH